MPAKVPSGMAKGEMRERCPGRFVLSTKQISNAVRLMVATVQLVTIVTDDMGRLIPTLVVMISNVFQVNSMVTSCRSRHFQS